MHAVVPLHALIPQQAVSPAAAAGAKLSADLYMAKNAAAAATLRAAPLATRVPSSGGFVPPLTGMSAASHPWGAQAAARRPLATSHTLPPTRMASPT